MKSPIIVSFLLIKQALSQRHFLCESNFENILVYGVKVT